MTQEPATESPCFALRRFPSRQSLIYGLMVSVNLMAIFGLNGAWALLFGGVILGSWMWLIFRPRRVLRLTETELRAEIDLLGAIRIQRQQVEEISPSSKGVIISSRNGGAPVYTNIHASWFHESVWRQAYPALLSWAENDAG